MKQNSKKNLLRLLQGEKIDKMPVWFMRQAGRYLPEYRALRREAGSFLDLCYTAEFAIEVTLQPLKRFDLDAAILFSDILVIPDALGQKVAFKEGIGPVLEPMTKDLFKRFDKNRILTHLNPVLNTVKGVREKLDADKTLIGFCGAPWTVATYMVAGKGSPDQAAPRIFAQENPDFFDQIIQMIVESSIVYLNAQIEAGADCVQIFDSWAGSLSPEMFDRYCVEPTRLIVEGVRAQHPNTPIIGFPKGAEMRALDYLKKTHLKALGLDWRVDLKDFFSILPKEIVTQGNLDPTLMVSGGEALDRAVLNILEQCKGRAHIFNLGHGLTPQVKIANVERVLQLIRDFK